MFEISLCSKRFTKAKGPRPQECHNAALLILLIHHHYPHVTEKKLAQKSSDLPKATQLIKNRTKI